MQETQLVSDARVLATESHDGQKYGKKPYIFHCGDVANVLVIFGFAADEELIAGAWLHDGLENTKLTRQMIRERLGIPVLQLVHAVTDEAGKNRQLRNVRTYPKIAATPKATSLKLADRIANVTNCWKTKHPKLFMYHGEYPGFRRALRVEDDDERVLSMWGHLDNLMGWGP